MSRKGKSILIKSTLVGCQKQTGTEKGSWGEMGSEGQQIWPFGDKQRCCKINFSNGCTAL